MRYVRGLRTGSLHAVDDQQLAVCRTAEPLAAGIFWTARQAAESRRLRLCPRCQEKIAHAALG